MGKIDQLLSVVMIIVVVVVVVVVVVLTNTSTFLPFYGVERRRE